MSTTSVKFLQFAIANKGRLQIDKIGSGVGVIMYSPAHKTGAGMHILSPMAGARKPKNPIMFADTAIPFIVEELNKNGVVPPLSIAIAGGAMMMSRGKMPDLGEKVVNAVVQSLKKAGLQAKINKTGGTSVRSMVLDIDAGKIRIT